MDDFSIDYQHELEFIFKKNIYIYIYWLPFTNYQSTNYLLKSYIHIDCCLRDYKSTYKHVLKIMRTWFNCVATIVVDYWGGVVVSFFNCDLNG